MATTEAEIDQLVDDLVTAFPPATKGQKLGGCLILVVGIPLVMTLIGGLLHSGSTASHSPAVSAPSTEAAIDPNAISPTEVGMALKAAARDPDSLVIDDAYQNPKKPIFA